MIWQRKKIVPLLTLVGVGVLIVLGLSGFSQYLGTRVSGVSLSQTIVGGALKSEAIALGSHTLEFRGRTREGTPLTKQVSFRVQAPEVVGPGPGDGGTEVKVARLKFRVDPRLVAGASEQEIAQRLVRYVDDINSVFARGTVLRFVYDPATDFEPWPEDSDNLDWTCETTSRGYSFEIYLAKGIRETPRRWEGRNCTGLTLFLWPAVYSEEELATNSAARNTYLNWQAFSLIHELGHLHGLGIPEYYNLAQLRDNSGVLPDLDVGTTAIAENPYWSSRLLVLADPMLGREGITDDSLALVKFSPLGREMINHFARNQVLPGCGFARSSCPVRNDAESPALVKVEAVHASTGAPLPGCQVQMYGLVPGSYLHVAADSQTSPMVSGVTSPDGTYATQWGGSANIGEKFNMARLFKVQCNGFQPSGAWLSTIDLQAGMIMPGGGAEGDFRYPGKLTIKLRPL